MRNVTVFASLFGPKGHMSVWSGKRKEMDHILRTTWTTSGPTEAEEARAEARAGAEEARATFSTPNGHVPILSLLGKKVMHFR